MTRIILSALALIAVGLFPMSLSADGGLSMTSARCAVAINVVVTDFLERFQKPSENRYDTFLSSFAEVSCVESSEGIRVVFSPPKSVTRGGGAEYLIDTESFEILSVTFER